MAPYFKGQIYKLWSKVRNTCYQSEAQAQNDLGLFYYNHTTGMQAGGSEYEKPFFAGHVRRFAPNVRGFHLKHRTYCPTHFLGINRHLALCFSYVCGGRLHCSIFPQKTARWQHSRYQDVRMLDGLFRFCFTRLSRFCLQLNSS